MLRARCRAALAAVLYLPGIACVSPFEDEYARFRAIKTGMTENAVVERLGPPTKVYTKIDAPKDYYVKGYAHEERQVTGKVLIYVASEPIAYVYLDEAGLVEHVFVGGS